MVRGKENEIMKKKLIVANWKCNPTTLAAAKRLFSSVKKGLKNVKNVKVVICPPFVYVSSFKFQVSGLSLGAQNCFWEEKGAFTGEISPVMLKGLSCKYVLVGHSEREKYLAETDIMVAKKLKAVLDKNLIPIFCIDNISEIKRTLKNFSRRGISKIIFTYEPVWAIGTGKTPTYAQARRVKGSIKKLLGKKTVILYGGSVNSQNALGFINEAGFDGLLIGGASLKAAEFAKIVKNVASP